MMIPPNGESGSVAKALSHADFIVSRDADAARRVVFEDRNHRFGFVLKLDDQIYRRTDVDDVVVGKFLAVKLLGDFQEVAVERAGLMRVFAVAQTLLALHREAEGLAQRSVVGAGVAAEVIRNRAVVCSHAREGLARQSPSSLRR